MRAVSAHGAAQHRILALFVLFLLVIATVPMAPIVAGGATGPYEYWVDDDGSDANPGTEPLPFKTLTYALTQANSNDTIWVEPGLYDVATNGETFPLDMFGETLKSTEGSDVTILDGGGVERIVDGDWFANGDVIDGFTFQNGADALPGGAMRIILNNGTDQYALTVSNSVFRSNETTEQDGGAISVAAVGGTKYVRIEGNTFDDNHADGQGGAIDVFASHVNATIVDNFFIHNMAQYGGAINSSAIDDTQTITGNTFFENEAAYGGAVRMSLAGSAVHEISDNIFSENEADQDGGALWLYGSIFQVHRNDAGGNDAGDDAGYGAISYGTVHSQNNVIGGCSAVDIGAAWLVDEGVLNMRNDTIADCFDASTVVHALGVSDVLNVDNSILWNTSIATAFMNVDRLEYSCVSDTSTAGTGVIHDDPLFVGDRDARLQLGSPCIDTGDATHAAADDFFGSIRPLDGDNNGSAVVDMGYFERPVPEAGRLSGDDRYETATELAKESFDSAETCVIASGLDFPDALSASGLAGSYDAPLLLTDPSSVPSIVSETLSDLGVQDVIVIGGTGAVSGAVYTALESSYDVTRVAGVNRYDTSAKVARMIAAHEGSAFAEKAFFARGDSFPDALAVSPFSYGSQEPILLTRPDKLPPETALAVDELDIGYGYICGGTGAVSGAVQSEIDAIFLANGSPFKVVRWGGSNRYDTARVVAEGGKADGYGTFNYVGVATGLNYPDALAGGVTTGVNGGVVLLTDPATLPSATSKAFSDNKDAVIVVDVYGGTSAVSGGVMSSIEGILGW